MSALFFSWPLVWAQANAPNPPAAGISRAWLVAVQWLFLASDPNFTTNDLFGGFLTWLKVVSLLCLVCWVVCWVVIGLKEGVVGRGRWDDYVGVAALVLTPLAVMLRVLESVQRIPVYRILGLGLTTTVILLCLALYVIWAEAAIARTTRRFGRPLDRWVLAGVHLALCLGLAVGLFLQQRGFLALFLGPQLRLTWRDGLVYGVRIGATYMGYIVFLRIAVMLVPEVVAVRGRRLYSIALLSIRESNRRMWAPWVVITVFLLVLAFTHWFLQPPRAAEMGRLYVGTLSLLCSVLLTVMVTIMTPLSLPTDIQQQTIYTVVSKPVRRLELIWGRMIGYMALVTVLVVVFGAISLFYLSRTVGATIRATDALTLKAKRENRMSEYKVLAEQGEQLRTRMQARVPVKGSLAFLDSRGTPHAMGIDVGNDQRMKEPRSHIEGGTMSMAIWSFGVVPDPFTPPGRPPVFINRRIPLDEFLHAGTIEWHLDRVFELGAQIDEAKLTKSQPNVAAASVRQLDAAILRNQSELGRARGEYDALLKQDAELKSNATRAESSGNRDEAARLRRQAAALHSPPITVEMTFNVYRTTKGKIGEAVYAAIEAINPRTLRQFDGDVFGIKEYYTNSVLLPSSILAGSGGALRIQVRCLTPTQYLGMAESDLYLLAYSGGFGLNYMKGLFGVWLQAMVLTAIGVCAGTFLSWPVALLTTIFFFVAGQFAFVFLVDFSRQAIMGGGPFESLIRILTHDNQMSELTPTAGVVLAKTLDAIVMPLMSMIVYLVPNFQALDVSNTVADGYMVSWRVILENSLLALAYAVPFSFAGYLILKNREVAA
ncbi:MAG: ABC transporter permease [Isosphaerales bacterium]